MVAAVIAELDDVSLVAGVLEQDRRAQAIVWRRHEPMVRRMLRRAFGPEADVDDLVQDIFLAFFRRVHALRDAHVMKAFVIAIAERTIRRVLRRKASARVLYLGDPPAAITAPADLDARQALGHLHRILRRLHVADRTVFVLRFIDGRDLPEISRALGVSIATTKRRVARAWGRVALHSRRDTALADYVPRSPARRRPH